MDVVAAILDQCGTCPDKLASAHCALLERIQVVAGQEIIKLFDCLGDKPIKVGDEVYEPAESKIEKLLKLMEMADALCRTKQSSRAFSAFSLPGGDAPSCATPNWEELRARYVSCCGGSS